MKKDQKNFRGKINETGCQRFTSVIQATLKAEIRRMEFEASPGQTKLNKQKNKPHIIGNKKTMHNKIGNQVYYKKPTVIKIISGFKPQNFRITKSTY
jgi:hypothetical protein